jgi:serine phosphatase RsbU (regulator of sigma subunit)
VPFPASSDARALVTALEPDAVAIYPLLGHGRTVGVLTLVNSVGRGPHSDATLTTLREVVHPIGLALDNARLYAAHRHLSETLQRGLITELPHVPHLRLAARYWPAARGVHIGGDWYDAFRCRSQLCLVIGDVTGHDRNAAVAMAQVRNLLRGSAYGEPSGPVAVLTRLDEAIADLGVETMTTAILATITPVLGEGVQRTQELRWSNAGHLPPLLIHPDGHASLLDAAGDLILGLDAQTSRHEHTKLLPPGSTVVFYTDGLIERRGEHLDDGLARLTSTAERVAGLDADKLCDALMAELGGGTEDDVALLAIANDDRSQARC